MNEFVKYSFKNLAMKNKKDEIFTSAKDLFSKKGFKDTNISEITKNAGVAVGTFYNYYSSKEDIFLRVLLEEDLKLKNRMFKTVDPNDDPVITGTKLMTQYINELNTNRILQESYNGEVIDKIAQKSHRPDDPQVYIDFMHINLSRLIQIWKSEGKIRDDIDNDLILALLSIGIYVDMHKKEIGVNHFPKIITLLYEFIVKGLTMEK
jgi:AcrR family transcriptional regulator